MKEMKLFYLLYVKLNGKIITSILFFILILTHIFSGGLEAIKSIGQIGTETLIEIVARSLWLISQGEIKVLSKIFLDISYLFLIYFL